LYLLDGDEGSSWWARAVGEAEGDCFGDSLHQHVQGLGLRMAAPEFGNIGDEVAFFISLDDDGEWIGTLGHGLNYTPRAAKRIAECGDAKEMRGPYEPV